MPRGRKPNPDPPVAVEISIPKSLYVRVQDHFNDPVTSLLSRDGKTRKYGALSKVVCGLLLEYLNRGYQRKDNPGSIIERTEN